MAGRSEDKGMENSVTGSTLRLAVTHKVSAASWIVSTYVEDTGLGFVVRDKTGELWLVSVAELLAPNPDLVRAKARTQGGPPVEESTTKVFRVVVDWPVADTEPTSIEFDLPEIKGDSGSGVSVVHLRPDSQLADLINNRTLTAYDLSQFDSLYSGTNSDYRLRDVFVHDDDSLWDVHNPVFLASDPSGGFAGQNSLVALNVDIRPEQKGALVVSGRRFGATQCLGLSTPLSGGQGVMHLGQRVITIIDTCSAAATTSVSA